MTYRLRYRPGTHLGDRFGTIRYPPASRPGIATREQAEDVLAAMPNGDQMMIEESA